VKLAEITIGDEELNYPPDVVAHTKQRLLTSGEEVLKQGQYRTLRQSVQDGTRYGTFKGDEFIGWVTLSPVTVHGVDYQELDVIYVLPEHRGSIAVGRLIYGIHSLGIGPIILGRGNHGGFLFAGGDELLQATLRRAIFKVSVLDLETGLRSRYSIDKATELHHTLVIEDLLIEAAYHVYAAGIRPVIGASKYEFAASYNLIEGQL
jgi:hypothetical protein